MTAPTTAPTTAPPVVPSTTPERKVSIPHRPVWSTQTEFQGVKYRSLLEAQWASFFSALGVRTVYESATFRLRDGTIYTADLFVPEMNNLHIELKPNTLSLEEMRKCEAVSSMGYNIVAVVGRPFVPFVERRSISGHRSAYQIWTFRNGVCVSMDGMFGFEEQLFVHHVNRSDDPLWKHPALMNAYERVINSERL